MGSNSTTGVCGPGAVNNSTPYFIEKRVAVLEAKVAELESRLEAAESGSSPFTFITPMDADAILDTSHTRYFVSLGEWDFINVTLPDSSEMTNKDILFISTFSTSESYLIIHGNIRGSDTVYYLGQNTAVRFYSSGDTWYSVYVG